MSSYRVFALIVAAGSGQRFGSAIPKQFTKIGNLPILFHTLAHFHACETVSDILLVLPKDYIHHWQDLIKKYHIHIPHHLIEGGETRFSSVQKGLEYLQHLPSFYDPASQKEKIIAVHDGIRMFVNPSFLESCFKQAFVHHSVVPGLKISESVRILPPDKPSEKIDRENIRIIQTPQCFRAEILLKAYRNTYKEYYTDDASVVEDSGETIHISEGLANNIKITKEEDRLLAEFLWEQSQNKRL